MLPRCHAQVVFVGVFLLTKSGQRKAEEYHDLDEQVRGAHIPHIGRAQRRLVASGAWTDELHRALLNTQRRSWATRRAPIAALGSLCLTLTALQSLKEGAEMVANPAYDPAGDSGETPGAGTPRGGEGGGSLAAVDATSRPGTAGGGLGDRHGRITLDTLRFTSE
jgi:hypothetical protein